MAVLALLEILALVHRKGAQVVLVQCVVQQADLAYPTGLLEAVVA